MRVQVMSDLHLVNWGLPPGDARTYADVLILAGDIFSISARRSLNQAAAWIDDFCYQYPHVVYVPGNHEFYGTSIHDGLADLFTLELNAPSNFRVLHQDRVVKIDGQRFLGGTLWQPHHGPAYDASQPISDHAHISDFLMEAPSQFEQLATFLNRALQPGDIVVTHHAPSMGSLDQKWAGHPCNRFFITPEMEPLILERKPALWVHGHVHTPFDYVLGGTRVVANPRGYPGEGVRFNPRLVLDVA